MAQAVPNESAAAWDRLTPDLFGLLSTISIVARRLSLTTPDVEATVPMLRGVWGAALKDQAPAAYDAVFVGEPGATPGAGEVPRYILRPAPPDPAEAPAVDWLLVASPGKHDDPLLAAWQEVARRGLGPERQPMTIRAIRALGPDGKVRPDTPVSGPICSWSLDRLRWPLPGDPAKTPCRLNFFAPLRLLHKGRLVKAPSLADIVTGLCRRMKTLAPTDRLETADSIQASAVELAKVTPQTDWQGQPQAFSRWSANQQAEIDLHGVVGWLDLPEGAGSLWPLLAAGQWLHLGKGTVFGLGELTITAAETDNSTILSE